MNIELSFKHTITPQEQKLEQTVWLLRQEFFPLHLVLQDHFFGCKRLCGAAGMSTLMGCRTPGPLLSCAIIELDDSHMRLMLGKDAGFIPVFFTPPDPFFSVA